jgi:hypothetical protein
MEILLLIGISVFFVAALLRSNEALDRVSDVEKEVKLFENEVVKEVILPELSEVNNNTKNEDDLKEDGEKSTFVEIRKVDTPFPAPESVHMR